MLKRELNEIGPAKWKIPFHSTYENFGKSNRKFWSNGTRPNSFPVTKTDGAAWTAFLQFSQFF